MLFEICCWQDFILIFSKGHYSRKGDNLDKKKKWISYFTWGTNIWNFKTLACMVHKLWHASDFILIFSKGHNSRKGDNSGKKKRCVLAIFPWGIHIACIRFIRYGMPQEVWRTDTRTDARTDNPKSICPFNFIINMLGGKGIPSNKNNNFTMIWIWAEPFSIKKTPPSATTLSP